MSRMGECWKAATERPSQECGHSFEILYENLALVKQQLGHKSIGSTIRYVAMSDRQASKATTSALMKIY